MATEIGIIKTVIGIATAKAVDGSQRPLQTNDIVFQNETILTGEFGAVEIQLPDGSLVDLGRNSETVLDPAALQVKASEQLAAEDEVETLQQAILDGADPTQDADPTAAGTNDQGGNEGSTIIQVQHNAPETTPSSAGFDTTGINFAFPEEIEIIGDDLQAEETDTFINSLPSTGENIPIAFDDDTLGGNPGGINDDDPNNLNLTGVLSHNFGNDGPGTVLLSNTDAPTGFIYTLNDDGTVMTVSQDGTDVLQVSLNDTMSGEYAVTPLHN